ncbi:hypothetical protein V8C86DRAFT_2750838 [Haematococcus lacustris]
MRSKRQTCLMDLAMRPPSTTRVTVGKGSDQPLCSPVWCRLALQLLPLLSQLPPWASFPLSPCGWAAPSSSGHRPSLQLWPLVSPALLPNQAGLLWRRVRGLEPLLGRPSSWTANTTSSRSAVPPPAPPDFNPMPSVLAPPAACAPLLPGAWPGPVTRPCCCICCILLLSSTPAATAGAVTSIGAGLAWGGDGCPLPLPRTADCM